MAEQAKARSAPGDPLYCIDELYLLPRFYADRPTYYLVTHEERRDSMVAAGQFGDLHTILHVRAGDVAAFLDAVPRYLAIVKLADLERVPPPPRSRPILVTPRYVLFTNQPPP